LDATPFAAEGGNMSDLIRREDAYKIAKKVVEAISDKQYSKCLLAYDIMDWIDDLPAVDAVEVRHGHWVTEDEAIEKGDYSLRDTCSVCEHCDWDCTESESFNFCPNCGAKMDGEDGDGDGG
jgi:hypothetical protein